jgi:nitrate/TMAO reductase-like tetraheme cytochrome c subunit
MKVAQQSNWLCDVCNTEGVSLHSMDTPPSGWCEFTVTYPNTAVRIRATVCDKCYVPSNRIGKVGKWFSAWFKAHGKWAK